MLPVFKEYIQFLEEVSGQKLAEIKEGYFWVDKQIIKGFDKKGNIYKFYKINVSDSLINITIEKQPNSTYTGIEKIQLASWDELIELKKEKLKKLEENSMTLIKEKINKFKNYLPLVPISTGKDSQIVLHLVRECFPDTKAIFNNTTLDCSDTYKMIKEVSNCEIMNPKMGFYSYIRENNIIPTRFGRFCCRIFKTGEMVKRLDHNTNTILFMGMRNEESAKRKDYGDEVINPEWGKTHWVGILPIREWSELDVWLYTLWKNLEINPKYKKGYSRVGCAIACPYYNKSTWILDKYWYPSMRLRWENILKEDFISNNKWINLNCTIDEYVNQCWNGGMFRDEPNDTVIEEYSKYTGIDKNIAKQYFNKNCLKCNKKINKKEDIGMNLKFFGRDINKFYCKKCLKAELDLNEEDYNNKIKDFKNNGCDLF